jgi:hypothetical protein
MVLAPRAKHSRANRRARNTNASRAILGRATATLNDCASSNPSCPPLPELYVVVPSVNRLIDSPMRRGCGQQSALCWIAVRNVTWRASLVSGCDNSSYSSLCAPRRSRQTPASTSFRPNFGVCCTKSSLPNIEFASPRDFIKVIKV